MLAYKIKTSGTYEQNALATEFLGKSLLDFFFHFHDI